MSTTTIYLTIGNSDDRLTQQRWADYWAEVNEIVSWYAEEVYGRWTSLPTTAYQNACWGFEPPEGEVSVVALRGALADVARKYEQDSIAWVEGGTEFIRGREEQTA